MESFLASIERLIASIQLESMVLVFRTLCLDASPGEGVVKQVEPPGGDVLPDPVEPGRANVRLLLMLPAVAQFMLVATTCEKLDMPS